MPTPEDVSVSRPTLRIFILQHKILPMTISQSATGAKLLTAGASKTSRSSKRTKEIYVMRVHECASYLASGGISSSSLLSSGLKTWANLPVLAPRLSLIPAEGRADLTGAGGILEPALAFDGAVKGLSGGGTPNGCGGGTPNGGARRGGIPSGSGGGGTPKDDGNGPRGGGTPTGPEGSRGAIVFAGCRGGVGSGINLSPGGGGGTPATQASRSRDSCPFTALSPFSASELESE